MVRLCAACLGCLGFSVSIIGGLVAGNPAETILLRALYALAVFAGLGWVLGGMAYLVVDEHARSKAAQLLSRSTPEGARQPAPRGQPTQESPSPEPSHSPEA